MHHTVAGLVVVCTLSLHPRAVPAQAKPTTRPLSPDRTVCRTFFQKSFVDGYESVGSTTPGGTPAPAR